MGAISVHLICGLWGTLAVGIFSTDHSISIQLLGVLSYGVFCLASSMLIFYLIDKLLGLRVDEQEEIVGLDISEHDMEAYASVCFHVMLAYIKANYFFLLIYS